MDTEARKISQLTNIKNKLITKIRKRVVGEIESDVIDEVFTYVKKTRQDAHMDCL